MVVTALKPRAVNARRVTIDELFTESPDQVRHWPGAPHQKFPWTTVFAGLDRFLRLSEPLFPARWRSRAIDKAVAFVEERLNGEDGLGAIYPAMAYSALMFLTLGYPRTDPRIVQILNAIDKLLIVGDHEAYCQPCVSPVWDTGLACHALMEAGGKETVPRISAALAWLKPLQVTDIAGDWAVQRPYVRPGGWAFQYANDYYPDLDDTAVVAMALDRAKGKDTAYKGSIARARMDRRPAERQWRLGRVRY
jgi:squalene-hopene/tetraprenyl-beta-curcumene cyclase